MCRAHPAPAANPGRLRKMQAPLCFRVRRAGSSSCCPLPTGNPSVRALVPELPISRGQLADGRVKACPIVTVAEEGAVRTAAIVGTALNRATAGRCAEHARPSPEQPGEVCGDQMFNCPGHRTRPIRVESPARLRRDVCQPRCITVNHTSRLNLAPHVRWERGRIQPAGGSVERAL